MQLISEIMTYDATYVSPTDTARQALQKMNEWNIHAVPVCDETRLLGMLSRQDFSDDTAPGETDLQDRQVGSLMSNPVICCYEDQPAEDALELMSTHRIRHLPVLNRKQELIGIVSLTDVANRISGLSKEQAQELLRNFGPEQLTSKEMRTHRLASSSADGKF